MVSENFANLVLDSKSPNLAALTEAEADSIRALLDQFRQLLELIDMERKYSAELISTFKEIAGHFKKSYHIRPALLFESRVPISDITLSADAVLSFSCDRKHAVSKPLESMNCDVLIKILDEVVPTMESLTNEKISGQPKQTTLHRLTSEIKRAFGIDQTI